MRKKQWITLIYTLLGLFHTNGNVHKQDSSSSSVSVDDVDDGDENVLNVHLVPHTHDDVGWLKTVDQYFYGLNNTIQHASVKSILDSTIRALIENPNRKFTYVEMAFFHKWWELQTTEMQFQVKDLVKRKQLTFVNGGWCMHDEATTHYMGMIDQTTRGHDFLKKNFDGYTPRIGWQLDPFGHSATQASLLSAEAGFDALFFGRIDYEDLQLRQDSKQCEGVWRASPDNLGVDGQLFWSLSGSYEGNYQPPRGFDLDGYLSDEPLVDGINIDDRVSDFVYQCMRQADRTIGNNIMLTMGSDFQYENGLENFERLDAIIYFVNKYQKEGKISKSQLGRFSSINVFYSNPEMYADAKGEENIQWNVKKDDFFPYADCENCFWTGYFTSRPLLKRYERISSSFLHAGRQIESYHSLLQSRKENVGIKDSKSQITLDGLEDAVSILQHHDGVSGTSKQHVANDYAFRVSEGMKNANIHTSRALEQILDTELNISYCPNMNISNCEITQTATLDLGTDIFVVAYNALSHSRKEILSIPVSIDATYEVFNLKDDSIMESSLMHAPPKPKDENSDMKSSSFQLYFDTGVLPPIGAVTFQIRMISRLKSSVEPIMMKKDTYGAKSELRSGKNYKMEQSQNHEFSNDKLKVVFQAGKLKEIHSFGSNGKTQISALDQQWGYYESFAHTNMDTNLDIKSQSSGFQQTHHQHVESHSPTLHSSSESGRESKNQNSGAYIFRPTTDNTFNNIYPTEEEGLQQSEDPALGISHYYQTNLLTEVHTKVAPWVHQVIRIKRGEPYIELEYQVGPIPIDDGVGKEIVIKYTSKDIKNTIDKRGKTKFYTDSNGREFMERILNHRDSWNYGSLDKSRIKSQFVAGNYYPINTAIYIEDGARDEISSTNEDERHSSSSSSHPLALSILTDRTQGGSSLHEGTIEIMVHRRTVEDDARGVGEPIDETVGGMSAYPPYGDAQRKGEGIQVFGKHRIVMGSDESGASMARKEMDSMFSPVHLFMTSRERDEGDGITTEKHAPFKTTWFSAIAEDLPSNLMLITLTQLFVNPSKNLVFLVRVGHQLANGESSQDDFKSESVTVDMNTLFPKGYKVKGMMEKTLSNNKERAYWESTRINWNGDHDSTSSTKCYTKAHEGTSKFLISPMKICTFEVVIENDSQVDDLNKSYFNENVYSGEDSNMSNL